MLIKNQENSIKLLNETKKMHAKRKFDGKKSIKNWVLFSQMKCRRNWNYFK